MYVYVQGDTKKGRERTRNLLNGCVATAGGVQENELNIVHRVITWSRSVTVDGWVHPGG